MLAGPAQGPEYKAEFSRRQNRAASRTTKGESSLLPVPPQPVEGPEVPCHLFAFFPRHLEDFFSKLKRLLCNHKTWGGGGMLSQY